MLADFPLLILVIGIAVVLGMIIVGRINAFLALLTAALVVSVLAPGDIAGKIGRVASAFGGTAGGVGIIIALAAIIGRCLMDSGAADRIVRFFLNAMGEKRAGGAMATSGFVLSVPVFFDTVFYLLVPLARSMYRTTKGRYLFFLMAIAAGGAVTHTLVPPTPGPLVMADTLSVDIGMMMMVGAAIGIPATLAGLVFAAWVDRKMPIEMRPVEGESTEAPDEDKLPGLFMAALPVLLPIAMITTASILNTIADAEHTARFDATHIKDYGALAAGANADTAPAKRLKEKLPGKAADLLATGGPYDEAQKATIIAGLNRLLADRNFYDYETFVGLKIPGPARGLASKPKARMSLVQAERLNRLVLESMYPEAVTRHVWETPARRAASTGAFFGNPNLALLLSAAVAMVVLIRQRKPSREEMAKTIESALMSGGVIILITAAGGAFGAMLGAAKIGPAIQGMFGGGETSGLGLLLMAFFLASLLKFAQGSSTVAMITASAMMAAMIDPATLGFHPVYLATAVGAGSLVGSWMNDSGFWIFCKMGGLTEAESLRSWTPLLAVCGLAAMFVTIILAMVLPLV